MKIETGQPIIIALQNPREKVWGILRDVNQAGVFVRGIDLNSFEDFVLSLVHNEPFYGLSEQFFPMWRIERITLDDADGDIPSMQAQFAQRTGAEFNEFTLRKPIEM